MDGDGQPLDKKWSKEVRALEKWQDLSNYTELASNGEEAGINNDSGTSKSSVEKEYKERKKALKEFESKIKKVSSNESPKKSPVKSPPKSPRKRNKSPQSPTKSPRKKLKDVLELPFPYDEMTSGKLRIWENQSKKGEKIDDDKYPEYEKIRFAR